MNRNFYLNFILTILALAVIIFGIILIQTVDIMRLRTEDLITRLVGIEEKIGLLDKRISMPGKVAVDSPAMTSTDPDSHKNRISPPEIANSKFFDPHAVDGGHIIISVRNETKNMNYLVNNESFVSTIWNYCNDSLAERNYEHPEIFQPQLAESWELSQDKMVYTFHLKRGILWHDFKDPVSGKEWKDVAVTAHDFKFYIDTVKNEETDCAPSRTYLKDLDRIEIISDYEFKVFWKKKYFLSESITLGLNPLPRHLYHAYNGPFNGKKFNDDHQRNRMIVGCGPYYFEKWNKGQQIVLRRNEKYYGKQYGVMPAIKYIVFEVIKHPNTQMQALISGDIDRMTMTPEQWVKSSDKPAFKPEKGSLTKLKYPARSYYYIGYNQKKPLFQDRKVRLALTHLVDRQRILKEIYHGLGRITTGNFFMDTPYYDRSIKPYPFSVSKAKELLHEAGWSDSDDDGILDKNGRKFEFTCLMVSNHPIQSKMLPIIKEDMAKAGIIMRINNVEWSVYVQRLEKKSFEVCVLGWALSFESDPYQVWHSSEADKIASSNHISFKNKQADKLIEQIRGCFDLKTRIQLCNKFHRLLHEQQPYTFLITPFSLIAQNNRYQNVRVFPAGIATEIMWVPKNKQQKINF